MSTILACPDPEECPGHQQLHPFDRYRAELGGFDPPGQLDLFDDLPTQDADT